LPQTARQVTSKLISLIQNFCHHSKHLSNYTRAAAELDRSASDGEPVVDSKARERQDLLEKWERNFDHNLGVHIERLTFLGGSDSACPPAGFAEPLSKLLTDCGSWLASARQTPRSCRWSCG
jgi:hypothetical protein